MNFSPGVRAGAFSCPAKYWMQTIPWNNLTRVIAPADPLISLDDAKRHVGASDYDEVDDQLNALVEAATDYIEGPSGAGVAIAAIAAALAMKG